MATIYVSPAGKNSNSGTADSPVTPAWANIVSRPGDMIFFEPGMYLPFAITENDVTYFTKEARVVGTGDDRPGILILGDYVTVRGFEVSNIGNASGIVTGSVHHATIDGNWVHHNTNHGIYAGLADYVTIINNDVAYNGNYGAYAGISVKPKDLSVPGEGYHGIIKNNWVHHNEQKIGDRHTDGFGIIWDNNPEEPYPYSVLISNNTVYRNGHEGILIFNGAKMYILGNTVGYNGQDGIIPTERLGEIEFRDSSAHVVGNEIVAPAGHKTIVVTGRERGHNFFWRNNLTYVHGSPGESGLLSVGIDHKMPLPQDNYLGMHPGADFFERISND